MSAKPDTAGRPNERRTDCNECNTLSRRRFVAAAGATGVALATGAGTAAAAQESGSSRAGLNWSSNYVQNPYFAEGSLTKAKHRMEWGTDDSALINYENDQGEKDSLPGHVDREDTDNVVEVRADKLDVPDFRAFPRGEKYDEDGDGDANTDVSALDATHWSGTNSTNGTISISDADTDVEKALNVASSSVPSGETVKATFTDVAVSEDAGKRYFQAIVNVNTLESGALVELVIRDDDGDEKILKIDPSGDSANADVIATATGNGYVVQQRLGDLSTAGSGDGTFDSIQEAEIRISDANADLTLTALNGEKMDRWKFGSYLQNEGTDDETRVSRYEPGAGTFTATGLDTFSSELTADGAVFYDVAFPVRYTMEESTLAFEWELEEAGDYPSYDYQLTQRGKAVVPTGYDLVHSGLEFADDVAAPSDRYKSVKTAEGVEDTAFEDISWTSQGSAYDSQGTTVTLDSTVQAGTTHAYEATLLLTASNWEDDAKASDSSGGGAAAMEDGGGGGFMSLILAALTGVLGFFGLRRRMG